MAKKTSVGIVLVTKLPGIGLVAVLQRRGIWNTEKAKFESWPGGCQVTAHGRVEEGEELLAALNREVAEELGGEFLSHIMPQLLAPAEVFHSDGSDELAFTYGVRVDPNTLKVVRLGPDSGGLCFVTPEGVADIQDLRTYDKGIGVTDLRTIAMFDDEKWAVAAALARFGS